MWARRSTSRAGGTSARSSVTPVRPGTSGDPGDPQTEYVRLPARTAASPVGRQTDFDVPALAVDQDGYIYVSDARGESLPARIAEIRLDAAPSSARVAAPIAADTEIRLILSTLATWTSMAIRAAMSGSDRSFGTHGAVRLRGGPGSLSTGNGAICTSQLRSSRTTTVRVAVDPIEPYLVAARAELCNTRPGGTALHESSTTLGREVDCTIPARRSNQRRSRMRLAAHRRAQALRQPIGTEQVQRLRPRQSPSRPTSRRQSASEITAHKAR